MQPSAAAATPPPPASLSELPAYPPEFVRRRLITFVGIVLGYSCFYLTRNSLTYTAPVMVSQPASQRAERAVPPSVTHRLGASQQHACAGGCASRQRAVQGAADRGAAGRLVGAGNAPMCNCVCTACCSRCQVADPSLPIGMTEIGTMTSIFPIAYGFR